MSLKQLAGLLQCIPTYAYLCKFEACRVVSIIWSVANTSLRPAGEYHLLVSDIAIDKHWHHAFVLGLVGGHLPLGELQVQVTAFLAEGIVRMQEWVYAWSKNAGLSRIRWVVEVVYAAPIAPSTEQRVQVSIVSRTLCRVVSFGLLPEHADRLPSHEVSLDSREETTPDLVHGLPRR